MKIREKSGKFRKIPEFSTKFGKIRQKLVRVKVRFESAKWRREKGEGEKRGGEKKEGGKRGEGKREG